MVRKAISLHSYKLDTLLRVHNVFYSQLLQPVKEKALLGQVVINTHLFAQIIDKDLKYTVNKILDKKGKDSCARCLIK
jgi:hypothetical protein